MFASVVRKPNRSQLASPSLTFRTQVQGVQIPAKAATGRLSSSAYQTGCHDRPTWSGSLHEVKGTRQLIALDVDLSVTVDFVAVVPAPADDSPIVREVIDIARNIGLEIEDDQESLRRG